jgi:hypothetical protein
LSSHRNTQPTGHLRPVTHVLRLVEAESRWEPCLEWGISSERAFLVCSATGCVLLARVAAPLAMTIVTEMATPPNRFADVATRRRGERGGSIFSGYGVIDGTEGYVEPCPQSLTLLHVSDRWIAHSLLPGGNISICTLDAKQPLIHTIVAPMNLGIFYCRLSASLFVYSTGAGRLSLLNIDERSEIVLWPDPNASSVDLFDQSHRPTRYGNMMIWLSNINLCFLTIAPAECAYHLQRHPLDLRVLEELPNVSDRSPLVVHGDSLFCTSKDGQLLELTLQNLTGKTDPRLG